MTPSIETPDRDDATAIRTENLTKTYPGVFEAVKSINAEHFAGEVFGLLGLLGPNGAGKSMTVGYDRTPSGSTPVELRKRYPPTPIHRAVMPAPVISSSTPTAPNQEKP